MEIQASSSLSQLQPSLVCLAWLACPCFSSYQGRREKFSCEWNTEAARCSTHPRRIFLIEESWQLRWLLGVRGGTGITPLDSHPHCHHHTTPTIITYITQREFRLYQNPSNRCCCCKNLQVIFFRSQFTYSVIIMRVKEKQEKCCMDKYHWITFNPNLTWQIYVTLSEDKM